LLSSNAIIIFCLYRIRFSREIIIVVYRAGAHIIITIRSYTESACDDHMIGHRLQWNLL
jgi:hypothetical protein